MTTPPTSHPTPHPTPHETTPPSALARLLETFRQAAQTEREKGTYFEELVKTYLLNEPKYKALFNGKVYLWEEWRALRLREHNEDPGADAGIDLVAVEDVSANASQEMRAGALESTPEGESQETRAGAPDNPRIFAIQAKFYDADAKITKNAGIDSFLSAMGKKPYTDGMLFLTSHQTSEHVANLLSQRDKPILTLSLQDLENSQIDWAKYQPHQPRQALVMRQKKALREHQTSAVNAVLHGLQAHARGKLIMACGTGKTFTSLKIAESLAGKGARVLFLVPGLSLLSQTLTEWTQESAVPLHSFAVCSDSDVGKKRSANEDALQTLTHELGYPATTDAARLAHAMTKRHDAASMTVVFSTYHSIEVLSRAQHLHGLPPFDLVVCDEAHRTTGATFGDDSESAFVRVHDDAFLQAKKRLYMTATPRIYGDAAKITAERSNVALCSMDDEALYGPELHVITFSQAVQRGLLVDYKVLVLAVDESHVSRRLQSLLSDDNNQLKVDDAAKIVGCWKALAKQDLARDLAIDPAPMRRAVAFCQVIEAPNQHTQGAPRTKSKTHKVSSKNIAAMFAKVVEAYKASEKAQQDEKQAHEELSPLQCQADHVDGSMSASEKEAKLAWLKADAPVDTCRILSNVRCLSEGVDVPALDAVLFLTPRNSQVDVVQSVGRVMRNAPGKKLGYVILPVVIPAGIDPKVALDDNKVYGVVWQVLQALRAHDDHFDAEINKMELMTHGPKKIEVIAVTEKLERPQRDHQRNQQKAADAARGGQSIGASEQGAMTLGQGQAQGQGSRLGQGQYSLSFEIGELERAIKAKVVEKVGNRLHWEEWANDIAKIAGTHIDRINGILETSTQNSAQNSTQNPAHARARQAFDRFAAELRDDLNNSITDAEIVEMLAQHLITKPVFDALFSNDSFAKHNPMSRAMQSVLDILQSHNLDKEVDTLQAFYESVKRRAEGIDNAEGKQKIVVELYDKFFRNAFPKMTERLGIVYTPVEVVDFIIQSVAHVLKDEFGQTLGSKGVHIIDPFTGTGTFITRLLQSGLITPEELPHKYQKEIHANELVLLAYYIAAINIEAAYHDIIQNAQNTQNTQNTQNIQNAQNTQNTQNIQNTKNAHAPGSNAPGAYTPFEGICLTDTFQMYEKEDLVNQILVDNSARRRRQKTLDIQVIVGNPPYSIGQKSENDNNDNVAYPHLDERIRRTYAAQSSATTSKSQYDSYIRAIRWASDRIQTSGVVAFVCGAGFIEKPAMDGMRKTLASEFSNIYVFNLRGDIRKNMLTQGRAKEGQNIFGSGSMTGIAIMILVKNPNAKQYGQISYHDIGDQLTRKEKLQKVADLVSLDGITQSGGWQRITPDAHGDWLRQRDDSFSQFIVLGHKEKTPAPKLFENFSLGVGTNRDAWCYNFSREAVSQNMGRMVDFFNAESERFAKAHGEKSTQEKAALVNDFVNPDATKISWSSSLIPDLVNAKKGTFEARQIVQSLYRPFTKEWLYFDAMFNHRQGQMPRIFPNGQAQNLVITINANYAGNGHIALISNALPDLHINGDSQCFPLYLYDAPGKEGAGAGANPGTHQGAHQNPHADLFEVQAQSTQAHVHQAQMDSAAHGTRRDAITQEGLQHFQNAYPGETLTKEDVFYYVYGLLHSSDYRSRYADNLSKELPRIPCVKSAADFWAFSRAGRQLAQLHLHYESAAPYPAVIEGDDKNLPGSAYRVEKMKHGKSSQAGAKKDLSVIHYNDRITVRGVPLAAYDYVVNGKSAIAWVMERQTIKTDKASQITNDANDWAQNTMNNPRYPLDLLLRVITVSLETLKIVEGLPALGV